MTPTATWYHSSEQPTNINQLEYKFNGSNESIHITIDLFHNVNTLSFFGEHGQWWLAFPLRLFPLRSSAAVVSLGTPRSGWRKKRLPLPWRIHGAGILVYIHIYIYIWYIYMLTFGVYIYILMGSMLPYIAAPWIRHGTKHYHFGGHPLRQSMTVPIARIRQSRCFWNFKWWFHNLWV